MFVKHLVGKLKIRTKSGDVVPLDLNWAQQKYFDVAERQMRETGRVRIIVLKARQIGISTATEAFLFTMSFLFDRYRGLVVAHEQDASDNIFAMTQLYWDTYYAKPLYSTRYAGRKHLEWVETDSAIRVATAGKKEVGRSATFNFIHASELAFWPDPSVSMLGLRQTLPQTAGSVLILESTANGRGNYWHSEWLSAVSGESEFQPLFFPWWRHPEYTATAIGIPNTIPTELDEEEQALVKLFRNPPSARWNDFEKIPPLTKEEIADRLVWRRYAIVNLAGRDLLKFQQEYPATPDEAFQATGTNIFPQDKLDAVFHEEHGTRGILIRNGNSVTFTPTADGPLVVFKTPSPDLDWGGYYFVCGDPTRTTRGDYAVIQVINRRNLEQMAVWRKRIDPGTFGEELFKLGLYYNTAMVNTETTGPGYMTIGKLLGMNYPSVWRKSLADHTPGNMALETYGWATNNQTKNNAIGWLLKVVVDGSIIIHDRITYQEMSNYVSKDNGEYGPADEEHGFDDCVMSLAIAIASHAAEPPVPPYGSSATVAPGSDSLPAALPWESWGTPDQPKTPLSLEVTNLGAHE